jgi:type II secretory pathway pseudopilin PulG
MNVLMNHPRVLTASRSEAGFALMETLVAAVILAMVAMAVLAGINGATGSTGREKSRSVAASLAEQDQERMRSMQLESLATLDEDRTVAIDGASYKVHSEGKWISDSTGGTPSCQNNSKQADYLQITSQVNSAVVGTKTKPVLIQSLVAPTVVYSSTRGSLAVQVNNRDHAGVPGIAVTISGPSSDVAETNAQGCAVFPYIPVGNYDIKLNRPGWVEHFGNQIATGNQDVTAGTLNVRTMDYDQAATIVTTFGTYKPGSTTAATGNLLNSKTFRASATNGGEPGMQRVFPDAIPVLPAFQMTLDSLFPFESEYGVYTGVCAENNPVLYDTDYYPSFTGAVKTNPAGTHSVTVRQPPMNIQVKNPSGTLTNGFSIRATLETAECGVADRNYVMTTVNNPTPNTNGWVSQPQLVVAGVPVGIAFDPGLPFGIYDLCIWDPASRKRLKPTDYDNTNPLGRTTTKTYPDSSFPWSTSTYSSFANACPAA